MFDIINALMLLNLSPNVDFTLSKHFAGTFSSVAHELKVREDRSHQDGFFPESTALSFELSSKLPLFSRHSFLSLRCFFFLSHDKLNERKNFFCKSPLTLSLDYTFP